MRAGLVWVLGAVLCAVSVFGNEVEGPDGTHALCPRMTHALGLAQDDDILALLRLAPAELKARLLNFLHVETAPKHRAPIPENVARLRTMLPERPFVISAEKARELGEALGVTPDELLIDLIPIAKDFASPPISRYLVGEAGRAGSGRIYLGVNVEYEGHPLFQTIHGEQFLVAMMLLHGETRAEAFSMPAAPCGHCRQFMWELEGASDLRIVVPGRSTLQRLSNLLPDPFGPKDLGVRGALLAHPREDVKLAGAVESTAGWRELQEAAVEAARHSYAPYSGPAAIAVRARGKIYRGPYMDNAAFNPSLPSFQVATVGMIMDGVDLSEIEAVALVERPGDMKTQEANTLALLAKSAPRAVFRVYALAPAASSTTP